MTLIKQIKYKSYSLHTRTHRQRYYEFHISNDTIKNQSQYRLDSEGR